MNAYTGVATCRDCGASYRHTPAADDVTVFKVWILVALAAARHADAYSHTLDFRPGPFGPTIIEPEVVN